MKKKFKFIFLSQLLLFNTQITEAEHLNEKARVLLFGDSLTAGMYFLYLDDESAKQGWAAQLLSKTGIEPDLPGFDHPYPLDNLTLTKNGFGFLGLRNIINLLPIAFTKGRHKKDRNIIAVPGQTLKEVLNQSSENHGKKSASWIFGRVLLRQNESLIRAAENSGEEYEWIILWIGANDLLSSFGMLGDATPPSQEEFKRDYAVLAARLGRLLKDEVKASHLLFLTLPDVTQLPMFTNLPAGSVNDSEVPYPEGSKTSAFLTPFRNNRFESKEVFSPRMLQSVKDRAAAYNTVINSVAEEMGASVVDIYGLMKRLESEPGFASQNSSYISPDLHHPSYKAHAMISEEVLATMESISGNSLTTGKPEITDDVEPLPSAAELNTNERKRASSLMRMAMLMMEDGRFPPRPTYRGRAELGGRTGNGVDSGLNFYASTGVDFPPVPVRVGWVSRLTVNFRLGASVSSSNNLKRLNELRIGFAIEPQGKWNWRRIETGIAKTNGSRTGLYARFEWRMLYINSTNLFSTTPSVEAGVSLGKVWGRTGHNGN